MSLKDFRMDKLKETYNWPVYYRELGYYVKQREEYERSLKYFDKSLSREPENIRALHGRAVARAKSIKFGGAIEDIKKILSINPDNIYLRGEKALITYLGCEFEDALIQNYRHAPLRRKPDNFVMGIMHCEDAILNCISERAGKPLRDHFKVIRRIAWMKTMEKQRPYIPVAKKRKKKKKSGYMALPTSQARDKETREKKKEEKEEKKHQTHMGKRWSVNTSAVMTASMAMISDTSSIKDSLSSHTYSLENLRIPPAPSFPYSPIQPYTSNMDNYLAERYLDKLYHDKLFLRNLPFSPGTVIANKKGSNKIKQLAKQGFKNVYHAQEILRTRRPFYFIKFQEASTCGKLIERREHTLNMLREMSLKQANQILSKIESAVKERKIRALMESTEKLLSFCENTSKKVFPTRQEYLSKAVDFICEGFYEMKKFSKLMNQKQKEDRIKIILGLPMEEFPSQDSLANDLKGWFVDNKKMLSIYKKRLFKADGPEEFAWIYHELSRFSFELKQYELSRMYARKCITEASVCKKVKWILNAMLLIVRIDVVQKSKNDAKNQIQHAKKMANILHDDAMVSLLDKCLEVIEQSAIDDLQGVKILEKRQKRIINLLTTQKMKDEAVYIFKRIANLPTAKRLSIMPGFSFTDEKRKKSNSSIESDLSENASGTSLFKSKKDDQRGIKFLELLE